jgi:aspartyl-tRNA(Asn)/glutamyl-tRNA(Gln) amidotransferase subunit B
VHITDEMLAKYSQIPELPDAKKDWFVHQFRLKVYDATVLTSR